MILLLSLLFVSSTAYQCGTGSSTIKPPEDLSQPKYFPDDWREGQPVPSMDAGESCMRTVPVPKGYYANVTFYKNFPKPQYGTYAGYSNNKVTAIVNDDSHPFIFMSPEFYVVFQTQNETGEHRFAFKIEWIQFPDVYSEYLDVFPGDPPIAVVPNDRFTVFRTGALSKITLSPFSLADPSMSYLLRQSLIFDSDTFYSGFLGTLEHLIYSKVPLRSTRNRIAIFTFGLNKLIDYPLYMGQDSKDGGKYNIYWGANCPSQGLCDVSLDGTFGNSMTVTSYNGTEVIHDFRNFPETAHVNVYENRIDSTAKVASLGPYDYRNQLPIEVKGVEKFYELIGSGVIQMDVSRN
uniref:CUB_2 domain-containing protein n=1 Tax=Caenorhabditis tropicalis TaxID=1561998 RepID=A0A1I7TUQ6_9PELO